ncbi:hypothetical protein BN159_8436 [Streptomyces davaonensis JCM 4913]|uniref:Uncharacterized protein n=1 Tax=Streptomyces davaonensis (strain DSM 101723 / JCM 4913 / KCC S-0913 / 768) TaxID=1214101 RepID=K4RH13_STRDJ|nr:hypothetical protein BN159_8436 [Streptomyces davaonensis JCM 4913]
MTVLSLPGLLVPLAEPGWWVLLFGFAGISWTFSSTVAGVSLTGCRQVACPPDMLGRVSDAARWINRGTLPLGALAAGRLATTPWCPGHLVDRCGQQLLRGGRDRRSGGRTATLFLPGIAAFLREGDRDRCLGTRRRRWPLHACTVLRTGPGGAGTGVWPESFASPSTIRRSTGLVRQTDGPCGAQSPTVPGGVRG